MIASLADAWRWYESARELTRAMKRLGKKHWDDLPWEGELGRDEQLRHLDSSSIQEWSECVLEDLDDLCVLLLFSVFEATVRDRVLMEIEGELSPLPLRHVALNDAILGLKEGIKHGSFYNNVLKSYKQLDANLVEEVNQVRRYRNWVAHGRRSVQPPSVDPQLAFDRLQRFLDQISAKTEQNDPPFELRQ